METILEEAKKVADAWGTEVSDTLVWNVICKHNELTPEEREAIYQFIRKVI